MALVIANTDSNGGNSAMTVRFAATKINVEFCIGTGRFPGVDVLSRSNSKPMQVLIKTTMISR